MIAQEVNSGTSLELPICYWSPINGCSTNSNSEHTFSADLFSLDGVLECGVDDVFGGDDLPLWDDLLHLSQEGDHHRVRFHFL